MDRTQYGSDGTRVGESSDASDDYLDQPTTAAERRLEELDKAISEKLESLGIPRRVTRKQLIAACEALGLDPQRVGAVGMGADAKAVTVELFDVGTRFRQSLIDSAMLRPVTVVEIPVVEDDA